MPRLETEDNPLAKDNPEDLPLQPKRRYRKLQFSATKSGRPRRTVDWERVDELCRVQATAGEIAGEFGCTKDFLRAACRRDHGVELKEYLKVKKAVGKIELRYRLWQQVEKGREKSLMFAAKNYLGMSDKAEVKNMNMDIQNPTEAKAIFDQAMSKLEKGILREKDLKEKLDMETKSAVEADKEEEQKKKEDEALKTEKTLPQTVVPLDTSDEVTLPNGLHKKPEWAEDKLNPAKTKAGQKFDIGEEWAKKRKIENQNRVLRKKLEKMEKKLARVEAEKTKELGDKVES